MECYVNVIILDRESLLHFLYLLVIECSFLKNGSKQRMCFQILNAQTSEAINGCMYLKLIQTNPFSAWVSTENAFTDIDCRNMGRGSGTSAESCQVPFQNAFQFWVRISRHPVRKQRTVQLSTGSMKAIMCASWGLVLSLLFLQRIDCPSGRPSTSLLAQPPQLQLQFPLPPLPQLISLTVQLLFYRIHMVHEKISSINLCF